MTRKLTLAEAIARYVNRFTMDHTPNWAFKKAHNGMFHAPQYASDAEWYERTLFPGEEGHPGFGRDCYSRTPSWPIGVWLERPHRPQRAIAA